jgi:hypothetical protein
LAFGENETRKLLIYIQLNEIRGFCEYRLEKTVLEKLKHEEHSGCDTSFIKWMWTRIFTNTFDRQPNQSFVNSKTIYSLLKIVGPTLTYSKMPFTHRHKWKDRSENTVLKI